MNRLTSLIKKLWFDKRIRFLFVGCLNTAVGIGTTYLVYILMGYNVFDRDDISAIHNLIATLVGQVVGGVHSYIWNKFFTFGSNDKSPIEFLRFVVVCTVQYFTNYGSTLLFKLITDRVWLYTILATLVAMVVSYLGHNFFSFKKQRDISKSN